jgi:hypothetical protein
VLSWPAQANVGRLFAVLMALRRDLLRSAIALGECVVHVGNAIEGESGFLPTMVIGNLYDELMAC